MKIAFLNIYSGINNRGAETFTHELGNRLLASHQVVFFQAGKQTPEQKMQVKQIASKVSQPESRIPDSPVSKLKKRLFLDPANLSVLLFTTNIIGKLLKENFDLVIPMNGFWQVLLVKIFQPLRKYKILITGHSGPGWDERFNLYLNPNVFIATTQQVYQWAEKISPWTRVELIPYAIDADKFQKASAKKLGLLPPIILCPAALVPYKRIELAIKATSKLKRASLLVLGKGELKVKLEKLGRKLLKNRFLISDVPYSKMPSIYKAVDLVTLPSDPQENSPMVFLESLAAGKLVITSDSPRNRWILGSAGIYCKTSDIESYREALESGLLKALKKDYQLFKSLKIFEWNSVLSKYQRLIYSLNENKY